MKYGTIISKKLHSHCISTKNRKPLISPSIENKLCIHWWNLQRIRMQSCIFGGHNDHIIFYAFYLEKLHYSI